MADLRPQHDEEVVAANHPSKADVTNRAWNVEHDEDGTHKFLGAEIGTTMIFGQTATPTGWTRKADWQDNAMLCYASAGAIGSGGAINPQSTHTHTGPSHTHNTPILTHTRPAGAVLGGPSFANTNNHAATPTSADGTGATGANTAPHYQEVIAATKD